MNTFNKKLDVLATVKAVCFDQAQSCGFFSEVEADVRGWCCQYSFCDVKKIDTNIGSWIYYL